MNIEKKLYQWDTEQKLTGCTGLYVDFPIGNEVYRVETADGTCIIPDELLQTSGSHKVYECMTNNTIRSFAFSVTPRPKPPDYVYTPTERLTFEGLVQRVDDAVADMIRRAESGEFDGHTPVKGTDYFTTGEIQQIQNEVSSGAIGEFKSVVDTETETFNTNAESKLTTYNENDVAKTGAYNTNASDKLDDYNTNASNKVTEYNSNAENKTAEFDTHTEQIQADISELKSDLAELDQVVNGVHKQRTETIVTVETERYTSYYFENPIPAGSTIKTFNVSAHTIYLVKEDGSLNIDFTLPITTTEPYIGISTRSACTVVVEYELNVEEKNGIVDELNNIVPKVKEIENVGEIIGGLEIYDNISVNITEGFYSYNLSFRTHSSYVSTVLNVKYGEKYKLTIATPNASGICGCILADDNDSIIEMPIMSSTDGEKKYDEELVAIPNGATKMYITSLARVSSIIIKKRVRYLTSDIINLHPLNDKVIVNFGDSIFGNKRTPDDISTQLAEITGATVYNCGFGGCRMSAHNTNWDAFSMYRLAEAIATGDFSVQDAVDVSSVSGMPSYFIETRNLLKSIKWNDVDIITIAYGTNDFTAGVDIDSETNIYDTTTFAGALRYSIEKLLGTYPHLKIFVCGQTYRFWMDSSNVFIDDSDTRTNTNGVKLTDFVQKTKDVSNEYHLKFIDNYYDLGINKHNRSHWFPSNDGTHHNPLGGKLMAEHMANELY